MGQKVLDFGASWSVTACVIVGRVLQLESAKLQDLESLGGTQAGSGPRPRPRPPVWVDQIGLTEAIFSRAKNRKSRFLRFFKSLAFECQFFGDFDRKWQIAKIGDLPFLVKI